MSRFPLRDLADRLTTAPDAEAAIDALLAYLAAMQPDWHATMILHVPEHDALERIYMHSGGQLHRRDLRMPIDQLPSRLVRKFFRPSAFFNPAERRSLLARLFQTSPVYEPDRLEASPLQPLLAPVVWQSCVCLPLADREDLLALMFIVSPKPRAFTGGVLDDLLPLRSLAALSLAHRMQRGGRPTPQAREIEARVEMAEASHQERVRELQAEAERLDIENRGKTAALEALTRELDLLRRETTLHHDELQQARRMLGALEEQNGVIGQHMDAAYSELSSTQARFSEQQRTLHFLHEAFEVLAGDHDAPGFSRTLVQWFCEQFQVERCSLMKVDDLNGSLHILAQLGLDPAIAKRVNIPVGQGVAGWVASHRKPLFVREDLDVSPVQPRGEQDYNSSSFISIPLLHRDRMIGVLNLSNKRDGEAFDETDLERAQLAGAVLAMGLGASESAGAKVTIGR